LIAAVEITVNGQPLAAEMASHILEVRVEDHLRMPDTFCVRIADPGLEHVDHAPIDIGAAITIAFSAPESDQMTPVFHGQVTTVEPEFGSRGVVLVARGYDNAHALNRTPHTQTYQNATVADIARKVAARAGLTPGTIDDAGGVQDFVQQNNETDGAFLWRLAARTDAELVVQDKTMHFRKAGAAAGATPIALRWGENLTAFRPRITGVSQVDQVVVRGWDPAAKQAIEASAKAPAPSSQPGITRDSVVSAMGGGTLTVADRPVTSHEEAQTYATSLAAHIGNACCEADGTCRGDPRLRAGTVVSVERVGEKFSGTYTLTATRHVYRGGSGYQTSFEITGRATRTLTELTTPPPNRNFAQALVIGIVTQNDDPDGLGRVRVKYPALGDDTEGWWARIATANAGQDRGLLMLPQVDDEVLVGFEQNDARRPFVLGSLWNGKAKPGALVAKDGSFVLASDQQVRITAKDVVTVKTDKDMTVTTTGKITQSATGDLQAEGQSVSVKANGSLTIEGMSDVTIKCGAAKITLSASGAVQISGSMIQLG
jgi:phage protein D